MALKKNSPNISDEMSLLNEVPAFLKRETSPINPRGGKDWIMFPNDMPLVSQILGSEPIMVQSEEAEEPLTITPDDIRTWLTGTLESGSIGFITGDVLYNELSKYVPKTTKVNGQALTGDIIITKGDIGLGNVDNTSDMNKPISNAVNNKFQELADTWGVDITQLKIDVNNIDQLLDKTVIEVNRLSEIIGELDTDFTGHLTDPDAHSNIRVNSMVDTTTDAKIPNVTAVRDFVTNYVSRLSEFTIPAYNNRYLYILNGANQQKISDTSLKNLLKMSTIYENVVTSPSQFPDPSTLTVGTIVRVGRFLGEIITDPYTSYSAKEGEILVFNGNTYEHFAYSENVHNFTIQGSNDKLTLNLNDQAGTIGIDLPFVTNSTPGILSPADYEALISMNGLTKYGTPNSSWEIGYTTGDLIRLDKTSGGALDLIWDNPDNPIKTDAEGNRVPYYAAVTLGDLVIKGNVTQEGSSFISKAETVEVKDNTLLLNKGETGAGVTKGTAGVEIDRGTLPKYQFLFDESDDRFKVGSVGDLWPVMIRDEEADLTDGGILTWDATTKRAKTAFNIDDLADKYLPLAGGTMTGLFTIGKTSGIYFNDNKDTIAAVIGYTTSNTTMYMGTPIAGGRVLITGGLYRNVNNAICKVWDESNDGANSGLDADLLDGQHGSYYAKAADLGSYVPLAGNSKDTPITGHLYTQDVFDWGIYGMKIEGADGLPRTAHIQFNANQTGAMGSEPAKSNAYTEMGSIGEVWGPNTVSQLRVGYEDNLPVLKYRNNPGDGTSIKEYNIYHEGNLDVNSMVSGFLPLSAGPINPLTDSLYIGDDIGGDFKVKEKGLCIRSKNYLDKVQVKLISETENKNWSISYARTTNSGSLMFEFNGIPIMSIESEDQKRLIVHYGNIQTRYVSMNGRIYMNHSITQGNDIGTLILGNSLDEVRIATTSESDIVHATPSGSYKVYDERNLDTSTFALKTDLDNIDLSGYLPLSAGSSKPLTGVLYAQGADGTGASGWQVNAKFGTNNDTHSSIEILAKDGTLGIGMHQDGSAKMWIGNNSSASKAYVLGINKTSKVVNFAERPTLGGEGLAKLSEVPTNGSLFRYYTITVGGDSSHFYPCTWFNGNTTSYISIHSRGASGSDPYNQNQITFLASLNGWSDMAKNLRVLESNLYTFSEVTIHSIYAGNENGNNCIYLRGGLTYHVWSNVTITPRTVEFVEGNERYGIMDSSYNVITAYATKMWTYEKGVTVAYANRGAALYLADAGAPDTNNIQLAYGGTGLEPSQVTHILAYDNRETGNTKLARDFTIDKLKTRLGSLPANGGNATSIGDGTMKLYANNSNEINFGGTNTLGEIWIGYRATDSRPIPTLYHFGRDNSTTVMAGNFLLNNKQVATTDDLTNYVTLDTAQTISGAKTFTSYAIFSAGSGISSDIRLKENLVILYNSEEVLQGIHGYRYKLKESGKDYAGLIAQEVQRVLPEAVVEGEDGFLTVDTYPIVAALVESNNIKTHRIEMLEKRLSELESKVDMLLSRI